MKNDTVPNYYDKVAEQFNGIMDRFMAKPFLLLLFNALCGLLYVICYGVGMDETEKSWLLVYGTGVLLSVSVLLGVISTVAAMIKKGRKIFAIGLAAVLNTFCFIWNMLALVMGIRDCIDWVEWIPIILFMTLSFAYLIYTILEIKKEIRGREPKLPLWVRVPMWVIWVVLFLILSVTFFYSKRTGPTFLGKLAPDSLLSWYWAFFSLLLNYCMTRLNINSMIYCKLKLRRKEE